MQALVVALALLLASTQGALQDHADRHADRLAQGTPDALHHSDLAPLMAPRGPCAWAGENVGVGPSVPVVDAALAASPSHAATLAHPRTHRARAVRATPAGAVYVVDVFCVEARPAEAPNPPSPSAGPPPPTAATVRTSPTPPPPICNELKIVARGPCIV